MSRRVRVPRSDAAAFITGQTIVMTAGRSEKDGVGSQESAVGKDKKIGSRVGS